MEFKFPEPGFLEGVKTKAKAIVRVSNMSVPIPWHQEASNFRHLFPVLSWLPNCRHWTLTVRVNQQLVNVLTGELIPTSGDVYQHENIRIAYIKQHAFSHIDHHLDKTPSEYIQWRFQTGEDRETMDRANKVITDDDEKAMDKIYKIDRHPASCHRQSSSRRKFKNSYEYECSFALGENVGLKNERWTPMMTADNVWLPRSEIIATHSKMVAEVDQKEALASGQFRPLVRKEIEAHAANFGLDAELVSHSRMRGLSGGQRVKVVLAACSWQRPHLIVLDEPTNYLDRDSPRRPVQGHQDFRRRRHHHHPLCEFTKGLTEEVWAVMDGKMIPSGHSWQTGQGSGPRLVDKEDDGSQKFDAMGTRSPEAREEETDLVSDPRKSGS